MSLLSDAIAFIEDFEGDTYQPKIHDSRVKECLELIERQIKINLTREQKIALTSFVFNCGSQAFINSTLLKLINRGSLDDAAKEFLRWKKVNNQIVEGLLIRREAEKKLFLSQPKAVKEEKGGAGILKVTHTAIASKDKNLLQGVTLLRDTQLPIAAWRVEDARICFTLDHAIKLNGFNTFWIDYAYVEIVDTVNQLKKIETHAGTKLKVPYRSQRDNELNPSGSCNVTSVAMCLLYFGVKPREPHNFPQFEDELYQYAQTRGYSRHDPYGLQQIIRDYGCADEYRSDGQIDEIKSWLDKGNPAILHGYFTRFGHIVACVGYNNQGFLIHDPWGEYYPNGYDTSANGEFLTYSYKLIREVCLPDGGAWTHFVSR